METIKLGNETYSIAERLGRGGTCEVFRLIQQETSEIYALKVLLGSQNARRFRREFRSMSRLEHPSIARVYEYGEYEERPCYSMEFIAGGDMKEWYRNELGIVSTGAGKAPELECDFQAIVDMFLAICKPLSYIHSKKILHRDLKPANIMLTDDGQIRLMDFGLIKELDIIQETLTRTGTFVGTVAYMSPEQGMGRQLDPRSDLYSLGVILYEGLTGRLPFLGTSVVQVLMKHINSPPEKPSLINPHVPPILEQLALSLLQKEPSARPASAEEVLEQLHLYRQGGLVSLDTLQQTMVSDVDHTTTAASPGLLVPGLIGREDEMDLVRGGLENLRYGKPGVLSVFGELGVGKSAFVKEIGTSARMHGFSLVRGACTEVERFPYGAFIRPLESIADRLASKDEEYSREIIGAAGPVLASICPAFKQIPWISGQAPVEPLEPLQAKLRNFDAIRTVLENFSRENGLVMILEDLQWADDLSFELIHFLARNFCRTDRQRPSLLLIQTWRPEDMPKLGAPGRFQKNLKQFECYQEINLKPLVKDQVALMIEAMLGDKEIDSLVVDEVYKDSSGNPFFIEEIVKNLVEQDILRKDNGVWVLDLSDTLDSIPAITMEGLTSAVISVPDRVRDLISQRLEKLDEEILINLRVAAVIGHEFDFDLLLAVTGADEDELLDQLDDALKEDVVEEVKGGGGEVFRFRQNMIRQVLYNGLNQRRLSRIHRKVAEAIQNEYGADEPEVWELLAFHYDRGNRAIEAIRYYSRSAERVIGFAAEQCKTYALRILEIIEANDETSPEFIRQKSDALKLLGRSSELTGDLDKAEEYYQQLLEFGESVESDKIIAIGLQYMGGVHSDRGGYTAAIEMYARSLKITTESDDDGSELLRANVMANIASVYMNQGRYHDSIKVFDAVRRKMAKLDNQKTGVAMCELSLGLCHYYLGDYSKALDLLNQSVDRYKTLNHQYEAVKGLNNIGGIYHARGDMLKAMECFSQSVEICRKTNDLYTLGAIQGNLGVLYHERGLYNRAASSLEESLSISRKLGDRPGITTSLLNLSSLRMEQGELRQPLSMLEEAEGLARDMGDRFLGVYALALQGDLFLLYGDLKTSEKRYERCRVDASEVGLKTQELVAQANLAWIHARQGKLVDAEERCRAVVDKALQQEDSECIIKTRHRLAEVMLLAGKYQESRLCAASGLKLAKKRGYITYQWSFAACIGRTWFDQGNYRRAFNAFRLVLQLMLALRKQLESNLSGTFFSQPLVRHLLEDIRETTEALQRSDTWAVVKRLLDAGA